MSFYWRFIFGLGVLFLNVGCAQELKRQFPPAGPNATATQALECLQVKATLADDEHVPATSVVVLFAFENRCDLPLILDWNAMSAVAVMSAGENATPLVIHDIGHRIKPGRLDGRLNGEEAFRFDTVNGDSRFDRVCVDLERIETSVGGKAITPSARRLCVDRPGDASVVDLNKPGFADAHEDEASQQQRSMYGHPSFGHQWNSDGYPRFQVAAGFSMHTLSLDDHTFTTSHEGLRIPGRKIGESMRAGTYDVRLTSFVYGPLYVGIEGNVGLGATREVTIREQPKASVAGDTPSAHIGVGAVVGIAGRVGPLQPHAELYSGARGTLFHVDSEAERTCNDCVRDLSAWWGFVSPRAGVDVWIHPLITVGGWAGFDFFHRNDISGGIVVGLHVRSFDGR